MISNKTLFKSKKILPVDKFFEKVLFDKKKGYYTSKLPLGSKGDFITAPGVSNLFSEIIGIWIVSTWNTFGKPKKFNLVELGPGDGTLIKILLQIFKRFPEFNKSINIYLYEKSNLLKKIQKKNINNSKVKWINSFSLIKKGPVIFFGNEFFDAIPIKQFYKKNKTVLEKFFTLDKKNKIKEVFKKASLKDILLIKKFKILEKLKFIELPKKGFEELEKMIKKISQLHGGILLIDYGYIQPNNSSTLQSVKGHKKNDLLKNLGDADVTSLVNFKLLNDYFLKNNLKIKKIVTQKFFLEKMGILERANNLSVKMNFNEQANLYLRLERLLSTKLMGDLFKVIFAYKSVKSNFLGFK